MALGSTPLALAEEADELDISAKPVPEVWSSIKTNEGGMTIENFLDRLMIAESGGNDRARNPLSTATGPFQFIESTFIAVMQRHFPKRVASLNIAQILALRTDRAVARQAAEAYTRD
ncbi:MAG: hypothetical protein KKB37_10930, partial [Alphaproteobacteria bacterium]|nr:hypothetical protein [Alphaproteobacteria bacterium]